MIRKKCASTVVNVCINKGYKHCVCPARCSPDTHGAIFCNSRISSIDTCLSYVSVLKLWTYQLISSVIFSINICDLKIHQIGTQDVSNSDNILDQRLMTKDVQLAVFSIYFPTFKSFKILKIASHLEAFFMRESLSRLCYRRSTQRTIFRNVYIMTYFVMKPNHLQL